MVRSTSFKTGGEPPAARAGVDVNLRGARPGQQPPLRGGVALPDLVPDLARLGVHHVRLPGPRAGPVALRPGRLGGQLRDLVLAGLEDE